MIWVGSQRHSGHVTWPCYQLAALSGNTTSTPHMPTIEYGRITHIQRIGSFFFKHVNSHSNIGIRKLITQHVTRPFLDTFSEELWYIFIYDILTLQLGRGWSGNKMAPAQTTALQLGSVQVPRLLPESVPFQYELLYKTSSSFKILRI